ncbi:hypothetical protein AAMO2058_001374200 [Amorphochlora amoebiformis]
MAADLAQRSLERWGTELLDLKSQLEDTEIQIADESKRLKLARNRHKCNMEKHEAEMIAHMDKLDRARETHDKNVETVNKAIDNLYSRTFTLQKSAKQAHLTSSNTRNHLLAQTNAKIESILTQTTHAIDQARDLQRERRRTLRQRLRALEVRGARVLAMKHAQNERQLEERYAAFVGEGDARSEESRVELERAAEEARERIREGFRAGNQRQLDRKSKLQEELKRVKAIYIDHQDSIAKYSAKITDLEEEINGLKCENAERAGRVENSARVAKMLEKEGFGVQHKIKASWHQCAQVRKKIEPTNQKRRNLEKEIGELGRRLKSMRSEAEQEEVIVQSLRTDITKRQQTLRAMKQLITTRKQEFQNILKDTREEMKTREKRVEEMKSDVESKKAAVTQQSVTLCEWESHIQETEAALNGKEADVVMREKNLSKFFKPFSQG